MVIVFCIDPVGTFTACTTKVIPKSAIITVTTADSKYSRQTDLGGPFGNTSAGGVALWPFRFMMREKREGFVSGSASATFVEISELDVVLIIKIILCIPDERVKLSTSGRTTKLLNPELL